MKRWLRAINNVYGIVAITITVLVIFLALDRWRLVDHWQDIFVAVTIEIVVGILYARWLLNQLDRDKKEREQAIEVGIRKIESATEILYHMIRQQNDFLIGMGQWIRVLMEAQSDIVGDVRLQYHYESVLAKAAAVKTEWEQQHQKDDQSDEA